MKNWKTTAFGIATVVVYVIGYFFPQYKDFTTGLMTILIAGGFLSAKDSNVTGGTIQQ
jgi:hypothetical protein